MMESGEKYVDTYRIRLMLGDNREISCVSAYTEETLAQQTTTDYLEHQLGCKKIQLSGISG